MLMHFQRQKSCGTEFIQTKTNGKRNSREFLWRANLGSVITKKLPLTTRSTPLRRARSEFCSLLQPAREKQPLPFRLLGNSIKLAGLYSATTGGAPGFFS